MKRNTKLARRSLAFIGSCLLGVLAQGCQTLADVPDIAPTPTLPDPHHHVVDINTTKLAEESLAEFQVVNAAVAPETRRESIVNQDGTLRAFSTYDETYKYRIFVEELGTGRIYEIQGIPLRWRPFSDLVWVTEDILIFDRRSQPHYGVHYAVNVDRRGLILASPFPDPLP